ncbi:hypothetical protein [Flavicella sediminum]|uniref:hypothetical protein n=1 Tax=Flavicella sediminum TaxID=2585141 RepID=UPI00112095F5|nr:hypothetical protein [Flavicella sediminum]
MNTTITKLFVLLLVCGFTISCNKDSFTDPNDPIYGGGDTVVPEEDFKGLVLNVDATDKVEIHPEIFGVNNDWRQIPDGTFNNFANTLSGINSTVVRYPGGWESEFYAWTSNTTPGWDKTPAAPGASVSTLKNNINNYSIVLPTVAAMNTSLGSSQWNSAIAKLKVTAEKAIIESNIQNGIVEIGNEWWLQFAGGGSRSQKLDKYVNVAMNLAEFIDQKFPNHKFKLLINGDYTHPEEFTTMKNKFTKAYSIIDGVALHTYTGYNTSTHNIAELETRIKACANNFNPDKKFIYLSEWMPSRDYNDRALYMEAANIIPDIIQIYARSSADAAAFWPPINTSVPGLGLTNWNYTVVYPVGQILGELSDSYKGYALKTTSNKFHVAAALNDSKRMVIFVTGGKESSAKVGIKVKGFVINSIESVERFVPADYTETNKAAPYKSEFSSARLLKDDQVVLEVNREGDYQIYKIVLKGIEM